MILNSEESLGDVAGEDCASPSAPSSSSVAAIHPITLILMVPRHKVTITYAIFTTTGGYRILFPRKASLTPPSPIYSIRMNGHALSHRARGH